MRNITLAVAAHVDAGKTTFSEQLLYHGGRLRTVGAVDAGNTSLDHHEIERKRGVTVFADQSSFEVSDLSVYLLDTPGHVDFSAEMERALQIADYALLLVSAAEGVQSHTKTVYGLLRRLNIPVFFFINKIDRIGADLDAVKAQIARLTGLPQVDGIGITAMDDEFVQQIAAYDEILMERYFSGTETAESWRREAAIQVAAGKITPVFTGSALLDQGVAEFMESLPNWVISDAEHRKNDPFAARVYRLTRDRAGMRWYYLHVESGTLLPRDSISTPSGEQKVGEIRQCFGSKLLSVKSACAGELAAVSGISVPVGAVLGDAAYLKKPISPARMVPFMKCAVLCDAVPTPKLLADFNLLAEEEPALQVAYSAQTKQVSICVMGRIQLEIVEALALERFGYRVAFGSPIPLYRETIAAPVDGAGHYEPLRHYAEVHLRLEPLASGSGVQIASECSLERLGRNDQNLISAMLEESDKLGVLTGSPLCDIRLVLLSGATHLKHTEGGDLKEAALRAMRQGLMKAQSILLEPWCSFSVQVPTALIGRAITDFGGMGAKLEPPVMEESGEMSEITGRAAAALLFDYPEKLASYSGGRGSMQLQLDGYEPCTKERTEAAVKQLAYSPTADVEHSPDSIFCSHGAGFLVHWDEADGYMHIRE